MQAFKRHFVRDIETLRSRLHQEARRWFGHTELRQLVDRITGLVAAAERLCDAGTQDFALLRHLLAERESAASDTRGERGTHVTPDQALLFSAGKRLYHQWYYDTEVWSACAYLGVPVLKSVSDLWNYQEIVSDLKPSLVVEFGTYHGGSALFFAHILRNVHDDDCWKVVSVDIDHSKVADTVRREPGIELVTRSSTNPETIACLLKHRSRLPGPVFAVLDSDHSRSHVLAEMLVLRDVLKRGDYLVVEDGNVNGHPVYPEFGPGPFEAIRDYEQSHPEDYAHDAMRENKFGFTFATNGFLIRK